MNNFILWLSENNFFIEIHTEKYKTNYVIIDRIYYSITDHMKKLICGILMLGTIAGVYGQKVMSLEECRLLALENNKKLKMADEQINAAKAKKEVVNKCKEIAKHFNVGYYAQSNNINGTFTSAAVNKDIPSLLIERGGCGLCQEEEVNLYKDDMLNILSLLNMIEYKRCHKDFTPEEIKYAIYLDAVKDGCWTCFVDAGQSVKKGDKLGVISDYFGNIIDTYYAEFDSTILYNTVAYSVPKGSSLVAYGRV